MYQQRLPKSILHDKNKVRLAMLIGEMLLILIVFNASSYFNTITYTKSINLVGIILMAFLLFWIWVKSKISGYKRVDLGLCFGSVSQKQWKLILSFILIFYVIVFVVETLFPSEIKGDVTFIRLFFTVIFTLTFGPVFEELLFRGYLFIRSQDVFQKRSLEFSSFKISLASIFSGIAFGFWHLPTPMIIGYFNDPIIEIYQGLFGFVLLASIVGIFLGEIRRKTKSLLPGMILHLASNSAYVLAMAMRML